MMRSCVADLKQKLEWGHVDCYSWVEDEFMLADILTKEKRDKFGLEDLMLENRMRSLRSLKNVVTYSDGEFLIKNRKVKDRM